MRIWIWFTKLLAKAYWLITFCFPSRFLSLYWTLNLFSFFQKTKKQPTKCHNNRNSVGCHINCYVNSCHSLLRISHSLTVLIIIKHAIILLFKCLDDVICIFVIWSRYSKLFSHAHHCAGEHIYLCVSACVYVL